MQNGHYVGDNDEYEEQPQQPFNQQHQFQDQGQLPDPYSQYPDPVNDPYAYPLPGHSELDFRPASIVPHPIVPDSSPNNGMVTATRRSTRNNPSGSEYSAHSDGQGDPDVVSPSGSESRPTRNATRRARVIHDDEDDDEFEEIRKRQATAGSAVVTSSRGRQIKLLNTQMAFESDEEEDEHPVRAGGVRRSVRSKPTKRRDSFLEDDEDVEDDDDGQDYNTRRTRSQNAPVEVKPDQKTLSRAKRDQRAAKRRSAQKREEEGDYVDEGHSHTSLDADGSVDMDDPVPSTPEEPPNRTPTPEESAGYGLRKRNNKVNYALPPPLAPDEFGPHVNGGSNGGVDNLFMKGGRNARGSQRDVRRVVPWGVGARFAGRAMPQRPRDDSDSDVPGQTPRRPFGVPDGSGLYPAGGLGPNELAAAAAGTPSNLGRVTQDSALADADPLGVNQNVTFDEVGGLDDHINSLKEMVTLPLLYPEVFQRFNLTPPRGVLFHGPPGTGKTLLARALAASSRSGGRNITFYMRKGADALSKWVGEAERQLRLLFDEAKASQPSIIFFDEIDGLAPVRSSKQDQIHASIVSTLLALMDGMDGRGQVIVIGATNRPDAIDPALRRPGRFDREFYFPLPDLVARHKILNIVTKSWAGWEGEKGEQTRGMLAKATKGYGGADLRALCTEAALNAVQRRYPQIYKSSDRLLLDADSIQVQPRDFMISLKKMIPSSARSTASEAKPLPPQLVPLLGSTLEKVKSALDRLLPHGDKRTVLQEAEFEDDDEDDGLEREMMLQAMETLRVHRPRIAVHGPVGMGQAYIGAAALHHFEGTQVQSMDLGTLMSDSSRTVESAIVQLFVEAKRHKPSIVYIPSLLSWCGAVSETARTTVRTMLDSLGPTDPILLLAVVDGDFAQLPSDVRAWFGHNKDNRVVVDQPTRSDRELFFKDLLEAVKRPPNHFPDGVIRKKRVLEVLPIAPPLPPRQATAAEIAAQAENDERTKATLTMRLGPILQELKRKFKRFSKSTMIEYDLEDHPGDNPTWPADPPVQPIPPPVPIQVDGDGDENMVNGSVPPVEVLPVVSAPAPIPRHQQFFDMDLEKMNIKLYYEGYLTPKDFLDDVSKMVANAEVEPIDNERLFKAQGMFHYANGSLHSWEPQFNTECERMAQREAERRKERDQRRADKAPINQGSPLPLVNRRSGRTNGFGPEMPFTPDPERRLKRARSHPAPGEMLGADTSPQGRSPKRARTASADGRSGEGLEGGLDSHHGRSVHFADHVDVQEPALTGIPGVDVSADGQILIENGDVFAASQPSAAQLQLIPPTPLTVEPASILPNPMGDITAADFTRPDAQVDQVMEEVIVLRTPSPPPPPLPDFYLDERGLDRLRANLVGSTSRFTVEQLEQLRASCLGVVWNHRKEWDRTAAVNELIGMIDEIAAEVHADSVGSP